MNFNFWFNDKRNYLQTQCRCDNCLRMINYKVIKNYKSGKQIKDLYIPILTYVGGEGYEFI